MKKVFILFSLLFVASLAFGQTPVVKKRVDSTAYMSTSSTASIVGVNSAGATRQILPEELRKFTSARMVSVVGTLPSSGNTSYKGFFAKEANGSRITSFIDTLGNRWGIGESVDLSAYLTASAAASTYTTQATYLANKTLTDDNINYANKIRAEQDSILNAALDAKATKTALADSEIALNARINSNWLTDGNILTQNKSTHYIGIRKGVLFNVPDASYASYYNYKMNKLYLGLNTDSLDNGGGHSVIAFNTNDLKVSLKNDLNELRMVLSGAGVNITHNSSEVEMFQYSGNSYLKYSYKGNDIGRLQFSANHNYTGAKNVIALDYTDNNLYVINPGNDGTTRQVAYVANVVAKASVIPTSSNDASGNIGDVISDINYIYTKTSSGWKRAALSTF